MVALPLMLLGSLCGTLPFRAPRVVVAAAETLAVLPLALAPPRDSGLRQAADSFAAHLQRALAARHITVVRRGDLAQARALRATRFGLQGTLSRKDGAIDLDLRLFDLASGDEQRAYFNSRMDLAAVIAMAQALAPRIAAVLRAGPP